MGKRRLFFGFEIGAPWPEDLPAGRLLHEEGRHLTLAFLGNVEWEPLKALLPSFPLPPFSVGLCGQTDRCLILRNVVAWHVQWLEGELDTYHREVMGWLQTHGYCLGEARDLLPHITLARKSFLSRQ